MLYKQANNTYKTKQKKKTDIFIQVMAKHAHTGSRAYCYTVHNLCKCPRRLFTTTVYSRCRCPTRPFFETLYTVTVNVQQKHPLLYTVCSHCQCPTKPFSTITVCSHCQCPTKIPPAAIYTQSLSMSNKNDSLLYTVHKLCQCQTRSLLITLYTVTNCQCPPRPFPVTLYTFSVHQDYSLLHCT